MALSNGLLSIFLPCSFNIHNKFSEQIGNTKPFRVACEIESKSNKLFGSISDTAFKNHGAYQYRNGHNNISSVKFSQDVQFAMDYERKLEDFRQHLLQLSTEEEQYPIKSLIIVDAIQRFGVENYFQEEIEIILQRHYIRTKGCVLGYCTLHDVSLCFRLLRQNGYHVSQDVFSSFKGNDGSFKEKLRQDIRGLIALYEAVQLRFEGENMLDEAANFSSKLLSEYCTTDNDNELSKIINKRWRHPCHTSIPKFTQNNCTTDFGGMISDQWGRKLKELAKMDFLLSQSLYQEEFLTISQWWEDLNLTREFSQARKPLKWCTWYLGILINDRKLSIQRIELAKSISFIYLIDDIFDLYGTLDELTIFTEAIHKWDYAAIDMLPGYMKMCYKALLDTTNEIGHTIYKMHGFNPIDFLKAAWESLCDSFLVEAKWFVSGDFPKADEYLKNGKVSSGVHVMLVHLFFLLGLGRTNRSGAISLNDMSKLIYSVATILRLWDDMGISDEDEHQDGSYVKYFMKDHPSVPVEQAREHTINIISREWKSLNKESFSLNHSSASSFTKASLNLARIAPLIYSYDENQQLLVVEEYAEFILSG